MASSIDLSFSRYVAARKGASSARVREGALYAYAGDLRVRAALDTLRPVTLAVEASIRFWNAVGKNKLLGRAVRVSDRQFPKLRDIADVCGKALDVPVPPLYVSPELKGIEARTFGGEDAVVMVSAAFMDYLSPEEMTFVIGRELGHVQNGHTLYLTAVYFLTKVKNPVLRLGAQPAAIALKGWTRRAEITADRAGLMCVRDLEPARSALAKSTVGSPNLFAGIDVDEYLAQHEEMARGPGRFNELLAEEPAPTKRIAALKAFAETTFYRSIVGEAGGISKEECDARVGELLSVMR